jgi:hypothetical protein
VYPFVSLYACCERLFHHTKRSLFGMFIQSLFPIYAYLPSSYPCVCSVQSLFPIYAYLSSSYPCVCSVKSLFHMLICHPHIRVCVPFNRCLLCLPAIFLSIPSTRTTTHHADGGHYVPAISALIAENEKSGKAGPMAKLSGIAIGDGWIDPINMIPGYPVRNLPTTLTMCRQP